MRRHLDSRQASRLAEIEKGAETLDELMDGLPSDPLTGLQLENIPHFKPWLDAVAAGDRSAFLRRLAWDTSERPVASPPRSNESAWVSWIEEVADRAPLLATEVVGKEGPAETGLFPPGSNPPFFELWLPFQRIAQDRLSHCLDPSGAAFLTARAFSDLKRQLLEDLAARGVWAAYECFDRRRLQGESGARLHGDFIETHLAGGLVDLFLRFPGLARRLAGAAQNWVEAVAELAQRLARDAQELAAAFGEGRALGQVVAIERLSEPHGGGRRVLALTLSGERKLVYKPRPVACEAAFQSFLAWVAERGLACAPVPLRMLAREGYGWSPWIEPQSVVEHAEADVYFERAGALLCLVELLGGTDLHAENVVAAAGGPVIIDAETLLQPLLEEERLREPVRFRSEFVSSPRVDASGRPHDLGGLQGAERWLGEERRPFWRAANTDAVSFEVQAAFVEPGPNVLYRRGRPCLPGAHREALARGFAATYRFLLLHRDRLLAEDGPLAVFRDVISRVILRPSQSYAALVVRLRRARFQVTGLATDVLIEEAAARPFVCDPIRPLGWDLIAEERRALREGDIPRFEVRAGDTRIELPGGRSVPRCFSVSGLEAARNRIRRLSESDLAEWLLELRKATRRPQARQPDKRQDKGTATVDPVALSLALGRRLADRRAGRRRGLYEGGLGVAVFLAALARQTGDRQLGARAVALALEDLARPVSMLAGGGVEPGCFAGWGGDLYGCACIAEWLNEPAVLVAARNRLQEVEIHALDGSPPDLAAGLAGAILGALAFAAATREPAGRELAEVVGERLIRRLDRSEISRPGVAHGHAGICLAFLRLAEATGESCWVVPARRAWELEGLIRSEAPGFLPGLTRQGTGWCRGSTGLGLVRQKLLRAERSENRPLKLTMAVAAVREDWAENDSLCCGMAGGLDLLLETRPSPGAPGPAGKLESLCTAWWRRLSTDGPRLDRDRIGRSHPCSGLFRGTAGVGYQLLRTGRPARWPSILTFEPPSTVDLTGR